jgi:uncharacterized protein (DUF952 family)
LDNLERILVAFIFHITPRADWESALELGEYRAASLESEGFIHCSTSDQLIAVANHFYHGQQGLTLLCIDTDALKSDWRFESASEPLPGTANPDFPHIYGSINVDAVVKVVSFEPGPHGRFLVPGRTVRFG